MNKWSLHSGQEHPGREVGSTRKRQYQCDSGVELKYVGFLTGNPRRQGPWGVGHLPVGGDSLLMAQAGGGSCTRSGELKLRRKEVDWGKRRCRENTEI